MNSTTYRIFIQTIAVFAFVSCGESGYLSPGDLAADKSRNIIYTALTTARCIAVTRPNENYETKYLHLDANPNTLALSRDGKKLYVACGEDDGRISILSLPDGTIEKEIATGHTPVSITVGKNDSKLFVANRFSCDIAVIDCIAGEVTRRIGVVREPCSLALSPDGNTLIVGNHLPAGRSTDKNIASEVSLIDTREESLRTNVRLPAGAQSVGGIAVSKDGQYAYIPHILSRYGIPITQLDRGWVNTNAVSIIDIRGDSLFATVLIDDVNKGAANPKGITVSDEGNRLYIAVSGTHELMEIDLNALHARIDSVRKGTYSDPYIRTVEDIGTSLSFAAGLKRRFPLSSLSPRNILCWDKNIYVSNRFTPTLERFGEKGENSVILLGREKTMDSRRRGEIAFHDASLCYQGWQSCASCHPDGRADALNWDQMNDGMGNPKNTKSLLFSHDTPPAMITGIRTSAGQAVRKGIQHILGTIQSEQVAQDMDRYLKSLRPVPSPYLINGKLSDAGKRGKDIFMRAGCDKCHNGRYTTTGHLYDVGTGTGESRGREFDTPTLCEIWRTAPYLYDGRALNMQEVLTIWNRDDRHGVTGNLSKEQIDDLAEYVLSL